MVEGPFSSGLGVPDDPFACMRRRMKPRLTIHIVDGDRHARADHARAVFTLGHHAEIYDDLDDFLTCSPDNGVLLVRQNLLQGTPAGLFERMGECGLWLPVIVCAREPVLKRVVGAVKQGALDYLQLPIDSPRLAGSLEMVMREAKEHSNARRRLNYARDRVRTLSRREREVLEWLADGNSNKVIARELGISPRTVEIHRANMMNKMDASHSAEAVRLWLEADLKSSIGISRNEESPAAPHLVPVEGGGVPPDDASDQIEEGLDEARRERRVP